MTELNKHWELTLSVDADQFVVDVINYLDYHEIVEMVARMDELIGDSVFTTMLQEAVMEL